MLKNALLSFVVLTALAACVANDKPRIIEATTDMQQIRLTGGMATQIELPNAGRVQSVTVGNPNLLTAERSDNIVSLLPKDSVNGETNIIVREVDEDGRAKVFQYRVVVQSR